MNNSTGLQQNSLVVKETKTGLLVFLVILVLTLCLHLAVQWCIYRTRLHTNNNYYLIKALSFADSLTIAWSIFFGALKVSDIRLESEGLSIILSSFLNSSYFISLAITMLIVTDRWIAIQFPLRYHALVTKRKIYVAILIPSFILAIIYTTLLFCQTTDQQDNQVIRRNQHSLLFSATLRLITCIYIIVFAKLTIRIRNRNEAKIQDITNFHGTEAERLDTIKRLTRSIKDVWKLNIWTCVFLIAKIVVSIMQAFIPRVDNFLTLIFLVNALYFISNPIVYLFCFTQIRKYWYRALFVRNSVNIDTD